MGLDGNFTLIASADMFSRCPSFVPEDALKIAIFCGAGSANYTQQKQSSTHRQLAWYD